MKTLINLALYTVILAMAGCGDDQAGQAKQQEKAAMEDEAAMQMKKEEAHAAMKEHAALQKHIEEKAHEAMRQESSATNPPWAKLDDNVYYYPE